MESSFKNFVYIGIGLFALAAEKLTKTIENLIAEGKLTEAEGQKITDEFSKTAHKTKEEYSAKFNEIFDNLVTSLSFASKTEIEKLNNRVSVLETLASIKTAIPEDTDTSVKPL